MERWKKKKKKQGGVSGWNLHHWEICALAHTPSTRSQRKAAFLASLLTMLRLRLRENTPKSEPTSLRTFAYIPRKTREKKRIASLARLHQTANTASNRNSVPTFSRPHNLLPTMRSVQFKQQITRPATEQHRTFFFFLRRLNYRETRLNAPPYPVRPLLSVDESCS